MTELQRGDKILLLFLWNSLYKYKEIGNGGLRANMKAMACISNYPDERLGQGYKRDLT